jgi:cytochrome b6
MNYPRYEFILRRLATILSVAILTLSVIASLTGILIAFYYEPTAGGAYDSLRAIATEVPNGWLILSIHNLAGNSAIVVALIQLVVMFLGRQFRTSWLTSWISGILLTLTTIGLSWTAMILNWSQEGFWRLQIELGTIEAIPLIGSQLRDILTGGGAVSTVTVEHLYTIHSYILSVGAIVLAVIHLGGLLLQEWEAKHLQRDLAEILSVSEVSEPQKSVVTRSSGR